MSVGSSRAAAGQAAGSVEVLEVVPRDDELMTTAFVEVVFLADHHPETLHAVTTISTVTDFTDDRPDFPLLIAFVLVFH